MSIYGNPVLMGGSGGGNIQPLNVTQNGTYTASGGVDGYSPVTVQVSGGDDPFALTAYIESNGTQFIDTGYVVKDTSVFEAVLNVNSTNAVWATAFGTRTQMQYACLFHVRKNGGVGWSYAWGAPVDITDNGLARFYDEKAVYMLKKINFGAYDPEAMAGGVFSGTSLNIPGSVYLLAVNQNGSVVDTTQCAGKLYRFRIYEDGVLVHEFLPWQENGVACLKDTVTGNLKYNAGTGSFVYGVDE